MSANEGWVFVCLATALMGRHREIPSARHLRPAPVTAPIAQKAPPQAVPRLIPVSATRNQPPATGDGSPEERLISMRF